MTEDTQAMLEAPAGPVGSEQTTKKLSPEDAALKRRHEKLKQQVEQCKQYRRKLVSLWVTNIDYRSGKPFGTQSDEDRIAVNVDWSLTKAKIAVLFSQIPQIHVNHAPQTLQVPWVFAFEQRLNDTLVQAGIEATMTECLPDAVNAAGVAAAIVQYEALTEEVQIPSIDFATFPPAVAEQVKATNMLPDGTPVPYESVPKVIDKRYTVTRISPKDFLWPTNFTGSDFDNAPWIGRTGRCSWAVAQNLFGLTEADKSAVVGGDNRRDDKEVEIDKEIPAQDDEVVYDEIFYKTYFYDAAAKSFNLIHRLVFVNGKDEPVINEPWKGQRQNPDGSIVGASIYPIRVLTLTYITDEAIPPSDTAIGRPQVNELIKSRTQMVLQRDRSIPIRWFDVNRIDPTIQQGLMRGTWQGMIPVQGSGERSIGEVSRAAMSQENFQFDQIAKNDLNEAWQLGPNQLGNFGSGRQSASEANVVENNFQTRIGQERAKVAKFFVSIAEVLGGLICLYEDPASFGEGFDPAISKTLKFSILADSTVLLDSSQRLKRLMDFINFTAKSGFLNLEPVLKEIATLSGLDPNVVIQKPEPKPPAEPNISLRLTGVEDMMNPLTLALLMKAGQAPPPDLIEQAKKIIQLSVTPPLDQPPVGPAGPGGPAMPPAPADAAGIVPPDAPPPAIGSANPNMGLMEKINKRADQDL